MSFLQSIDRACDAIQQKKESTLAELALPQATSFILKTTTALCRQAQWNTALGGNKSLCHLKSVVDRNCKVGVNDQVCNKYIVNSCRNGKIGFKMDCENVLTIDEGPVFDDSCFPETGGVLDVFAWVDTFSWTGCPFRTHNYW